MNGWTELIKNPTNLKLVEKHSNYGGLKSTLDWETTQRLLRNS